MEQQGKPKEITILALGGAGCRILRALAEAPAAQSLRLLAADTDAESLARSGVTENCRLLAGARWRGGRGSGAKRPGSIAEYRISTRCPSPAGSSTVNCRVEES